MVNVFWELVFPSKNSEVPIIKLEIKFKKEHIKFPIIKHITKSKLYLALVSKHLGFGDMNGLQKLELYPKDLSFEQLFGRLVIAINHSSGQITYVIPKAEYFGAFWVDSPTIAPTNLSSTFAQIRELSLF